MTHSTLLIAQALSGSYENNNGNSRVEKDKMRKVSSSSSLSSLLGGASIGNIYANIWKVLFLLSKDADPEILSAAEIVVDHIRDKVSSFNHLSV